MERLAARGWHNAVSPPLGLREVARTQIPGAHAPGFTIPPHFGGYETNASVNGTGMIHLAVQAQLFAGPASPSRSDSAGRRSHHPALDATRGLPGSDRASPWRGEKLGLHR